MSKTIQLHCPSTNRTVDGFVISPFQSPDQIYQGIRLALQIPHAVLYTIDAKPLTKLDALQEDQRILVAASDNETMLPDSPLEYEFYDGQDEEAVDPYLDLAPWADLDEHGKCRHIESVNQLMPETRNKLRYTRHWPDVKHDIAVERLPGSKAAESLIEQRWATTVDHFLPASMKPAKVRPSPSANEFWDGTSVGAIAVLASTTPGQARLAAEHLVEAVKLRLAEGEDVSPVVHYQDVVDAARMIYEKAGVLPAKLTKVKSAKAREKEKKKALREKRKKGKGGLKEA
jgi:hypothetical protein